MNLETRRHIEEILCLAEGATPATKSSRDPLILESWMRCMHQHRLDPAEMKEASILPQQRLREHQERIEDFLHNARFGVETLYRQVAGMNYVLLLTDAQGITVDFIGDPTFGNHLNAAGLSLGADWNESHAGTCAVGTCLSTRRSLTVHQTDHFFFPHTSLTCTSAPVFNPYGELLAVLTIAALQSPQPKRSQHLALKLVQINAHRIEKANFLREFGREWIVKFGTSQEFADVDPEFLLALNSTGEIIGFNHRAQQLLDDEGSLSGETSGSPIGRNFEEFFDCELDNLDDFVLSRPPDQRSIRTASKQRTLFAQASSPQSRPRQPGNANPAPRAAPLPPSLTQLCGGDPFFSRQLAKAARLVNSNVSILLCGETGTGKEHFAKAMHSESTRSRKPFVAVNCAAIPETLIESELFGYTPGAFTGARTSGKKGLILEADGGTLFLDEIGDMPLSLQARLLRVLAEREVLPVGAVNTVAIDIRLISATHHDLVELVQQGSFRDDLYYRINGAVFSLPPLRLRRDFEWLVKSILHERTEGERAPGVSSDTLQLLRRHTWPGNIRELVNILEYAIAVCGNGMIQTTDLPDFFLRLPSKRLIDLHPQSMDGLMETDSPQLESVLKRRHWNVSAAARDLGLSRATVYRHMKRQGIIAPNQR